MGVSPRLQMLPFVARYVYNPIAIMGLWRYFLYIVVAICSRQMMRTLMRSKHLISIRGLKMDIEKRFVFTEKRLRGLPDPESGRVDYHDEKVDGLKLTVSRRNRTYFFVGRLDGKMTRLKIGRLGQVSLKHARDAISTIRSKAAVGENEAVQRKQRRRNDGLRFADLWDFYLEHWAKPRKRTWANDRSQYENHLSDWGNRSVSTITVQDVRKRHAEIGKKSGPYAANRVLALLSKMYEVGRKQLEYRGENVAKLVDRFPESDRERFLSADELGRFFSALDVEKDVVAADLLRWLIWTGARKGNALSARWDEIDADLGVWTIPGAKFKNGRPQRIPLTAQSREVLARRRAENPQGCEWIFPGANPEKHREGARSAWDRIRTTAGLKDVRVHDLRRSLGSWMAGNGVGLPIIGATLGHRTQQTTAIYSRVALDPVRDALETAQASMQMAIEKHREASSTTRKPNSAVMEKHSR